MIHPKTVLCPTDLGEGSRTLVQTAAMIASTFAARLVLLHVIRPPSPSPAMAVPADIATLLVALHLSAEGHLRELTRIAALAGLKVTALVAEGWPAREILGVARDMKADLITMRTRQRIGLQRLLASSVCEEVIRAAWCPVLTLPGEAPQAT